MQVVCLQTGADDESPFVRLGVFADDADPFALAGLGEQPVAPALPLVPPLTVRPIPADSPANAADLQPDALATAVATAMVQRGVADALAAAQTYAALQPVAAALAVFAQAAAPLDLTAGAPVPSFPVAVVNGGPVPLPPVRVQ